MYKALVLLLLLVVVAAAAETPPAQGSWWLPLLFRSSEEKAVETVYTQVPPPKRGSHDEAATDVTASVLPENLTLVVLTLVVGVLVILLLSRMVDYVGRLVWHLAIFIPTYALCRFIEACFWQFWRRFVQPLALLKLLAGLLAKASDSV